MTDSKFSPLVHPHNHTFFQHLLQHPLCEDLGSWEKGGMVALHLATCGTLLAACYAVSSTLFVAGSVCLALCYVVLYILAHSHEEPVAQHAQLPNSTQESEESASPVSVVAKLVVPPKMSFERICSEALAFARAELAKHPEITDDVYRDPRGTRQFHQPINKEIPKLFALCTICHEGFKKALNENLQDWQEQAVIDAADKLLKVSYAISSLTLVDLVPFTASFRDEAGNKRTFIEALTRQDSYQYKAYFVFTSIYHMVRAGCCANSKGKLEVTKDQRQVYNTKAFSEVFYTLGTPQNTWNVLYNDFCERVVSFTPEEEWQKPMSDQSMADSRFMAWAQQDVRGAKFSHFPDSIPT